jgi:hypothetical protein
MLVAPFRVFGQAARRETSPLRGVRSELAARSEYLTRWTTASWLWRSHCAVGPFPGCVVFAHRAALTSFHRSVRPLVEFRLPPAYCPVQPSRPATASRLLSWAFAPYSTRGIGGPLAAGRAKHPLRSARRVWLPSRRFAPSEPVPAFFHAGGALGIRPSELSPRGRYPPRFRADGPTCRLSRRFSLRCSAGPAQRAAASGL